MTTLVRQLVWRAWTLDDLHGRPARHRHQPGQHRPVVDTSRLPPCSAGR